ncbi:MAG: hypothetical protein QG624_303, partial [Pseudomonadota bacterium]|nr:hypothetical protein [Pseudomonadota bacterium]
MILFGCKGQKMQLTWIINAGFSISLLVNALLFTPQILAIVRKKS